MKSPSALLWMVVVAAAATSAPVDAASEAAHHAAKANAKIYMDSNIIPTYESSTTPLERKFDLPIGLWRIDRHWRGLSISDAFNMPSSFWNPLVKIKGLAKVSQFYNNRALPCLHKQNMFGLYKKKEFIKVMNQVAACLYPGIKTNDNVDIGVNEPIAISKEDVAESAATPAPVVTEAPKPVVTVSPVVVPAVPVEPVIPKPIIPELVVPEPTRAGEPVIPEPTRAEEPVVEPTRAVEPVKPVEPTPVEEPVKPEPIRPDEPVKVEEPLPRPLEEPETIEPARPVEPIEPTEPQPAVQPAPPLVEPSLPSEPSQPESPVEPFTPLEVPEPVNAPVVEPISVPASEPIAEPIGEPVVEPVAEPVVEPVVEPSPTSPRLPVPTYFYDPTSTDVPPFFALDINEDKHVTPDEWPEYVARVRQVALTEIVKGQHPTAVKLLQIITDFHYNAFTHCIAARLDALQEPSLDENTRSFADFTKWVENSCNVKFRFSLLAGPPPFEWIAKEKPIITAADVTRWLTIRLATAKKDLASQKISTATSAQIRAANGIVKCTVDILGGSGGVAISRDAYYELLAHINRCASATA